MFGLGSCIALALALWVAVRYEFWREAAYNPSVLAGKQAVVVGSSSGIGREMVLYLARHGASVVAVARRKKDLDELAAEAPGKIRAFAADASDPPEVDRLLEAVTKQGAQVDYLFLNHAAFPEMNWVTSPDMKKLRSAFEVNFFSFAELATKFLPALKESKGSITVTSSGAGLSGVGLMGAYSASKHALHGFFNSLRQDLALAQEDVAITVAVVGSIDVKRREESAREGADAYYGKVPMWTADACAERIVMGAALRQAEIDVPKLEIGQLRVMKIILPSLVDSTMRKIASGHKCTDYGPNAALILCVLPY